MASLSPRHRRLVPVLVMIAGLALAACDSVAPVRHDFETSDHGWEVLVETHGAKVTNRENANFSTVLGPLPGSGAGPGLRRTIKLSGDQDHVLIGFDLLEIDSWDDELFTVWIDGVPVVADRFEHDRADQPANSFGIAGASGRQNLGFGGHTDQIVHYTLTHPTTATAVTVEFGAALDDRIEDEAWGIDDFTVEEVFGGGEVVLADVTFDLEGTTLQVSNTPLGAGNMEAPIGPGSATLRLPVDRSTGLLADGPVTVTDLALERHTVQVIGIIGATITDDGTFAFAGPRPTGWLSAGTVTWDGPVDGFRSTGVRSCAGGCGPVPAESLGAYDETRTITLGEFHLPATPANEPRSFTAAPTVVASSSNAVTALHLDGREPSDPGLATEVFEDFEVGDPSGWTGADIDESWPSFTRFLGRFGGSGGAEAVHKTFPLTGHQDAVIVQFDFYEIDSWDGVDGNEYFTAWLDGERVVQDWFDHEKTEVLQSAELIMGGEGERLGFTSWADSIYRYTLAIPTTGTQLRVGFGARLGPGGTGGGGADESWGIDNVRITEVRVDRPG